MWPIFCIVETFFSFFCRFFFSFYHFSLCVLQCICLSVSQVKAYVKSLINEYIWKAIHLNEFMVKNDPFIVLLLSVNGGHSKMTCIPSTEIQVIMMFTLTSQLLWLWGLWSFALRSGVVDDYINKNKLQMTCFLRLDFILWINLSGLGGVSPGCGCKATHIALTSVSLETTQ